MMARFFLLLALALLPLRAEMAVIVNKEAGFDLLSSREIARIFLNKATHLPDGTEALPVEPAEWEQKASFYQTVVGKNGQQLRSYWASVIFTGRARPPKMVRSPEEVVEYVASHRGAIGFVDAALAGPEVKTVHRFGP